MRTSGSTREAVTMDWKQAVIDGGVLAGAVLTMLALVSMLFRNLVYKPLVRLIEERTEQVIPTANGGTSLPDVARTVNRIENRVYEMSDRISKIEGRLEELPARRRRAAKEG